MNSVVAIIKSVIGQVFAVSIEGIQRQIFEGDRLLQGEQLLTGNLGAVTLQTVDGKSIELGNNQQWPLREEESKQQDVDEDASVEELQQAIAAGVDPSAEMDDTAAGPAAAGGSGGGGFGGGHSFVMLDATGQQLQAEVGYTTGGLGEPGAAQSIERERSNNLPLGQTPDAQNDAPLINVTAASAILENSAAAGDTVATFTATDEEDGTPAVDFTPGSNNDGYYAISGTSVVLTAAGATFVQGGGTLPAVSLTATDAGGLTATDSDTPSVNAQNDAPAGANKTITTLEDTAYTLTVADFGFSDVDGNNLAAVIVNAPSAGTLSLNGVAINASTSVSVADIVDGKLVFTPAPDASGNGYGNFSFQVQDDGGTANGGLNTDASPNTISFNVTAEADAITNTSNIGVVVGPSYEFTMPGSANGSTSYTDPKTGITVTSGAGTTLSGNGGLGIAVNGNTGASDANRIDTGENLTFTFPDSAGVQSISLAVKNTAQETVQITSQLDTIGVNAGSISLAGTLSIPGGGITGSTVQVQLIVTGSSGSTSTTITVNANGTWSISGFNASSVGTITGLALKTSIDGDLFSNGGDFFKATVNHAIDSMTITNGALYGTKDGYQIDFISFAPSSSATGYTYPVDIHAALQDSDGSESFVSVSLSGLPSGSSLSLISSTGQITSIASSGTDADGSPLFTLNTNLLQNSFSNGSFTDQLYLSTTTPLTSGFAPTMTVITEDANGSQAMTILGGSGSNSLTGSSSNDLISGGAGNDILIGGEGNDILLGGLGDDTLTGGADADRFIWQSGHTGQDVVKDFNLAEDKLDLSTLLQGENDGNILNYLRVDTTTSTLQVSTTGQFGVGGSADVTIKLENGSGGNADLSSLGTTSTQIVNSLIAGADPIVKIDHS